MACSSPGTMFPAPWIKWSKSPPWLLSSTSPAAFFKVYSMPTTFCSAIFMRTPFGPERASFDDSDAFPLRLLASRKPHFAQHGVHVRPQAAQVEHVRGRLQAGGQPAEGK